MRYDRIVVAYHGCEESVAEAVLAGEALLKPSVNEYDWLGAGIYFWEYGPERALHFAAEQMKRKKAKGYSEQAQMNGTEELLPAHPNAETHRRVMAALDAATPAEHREMLIAAGIMTAAGELTEHYRTRKPRKKSSRRKSARQARTPAKPRQAR